MKRAFNLILFELLKTLLTMASGLGKRKKLFIFIYHRVLDKPDFMLPDEVDKTRFHWQMELLHKYFNVLSLHDALDKMANHSLPSRAVCITFDDGYADNYNNALPILKKFNQSATFFIANGFLNGGRMWNDTIIEAVRNFPQAELDLTTIGLGKYDVATNTEKAANALHIIRKIRHLPLSQRDQYTAYIASLSQNLPNDLMMSTEQLKQLHQSGMEIGGHTVSHPILAKLELKEAETEIVENKDFLENLLNIPVRYFAYPNGKANADYLPQHKELVNNVGYQAALSTHWGYANDASDRWQLPRFTPWDATPLKFMFRLFLKYYSAKTN